MRAAIYNRFWHSQGGGERHSGMIASVLARDGVPVDLVGHTAVDKDELADHLGLDLTGVDLRIVPERGDLSTAALSQDYDLWVNGSYMSRLAPRSRKAAYLCYFPTPFDSDLEPWKQRLVRSIGPLVSAHAGGLDFGPGWWIPEGGRRRGWTWTSADAVLVVPPSERDRVLRMDLGGPGLPSETVLRVEDEHGRVWLEAPVTRTWTTHHVPVPASVVGVELHFRAVDTFKPGGLDRRELGVAVSGMRFEGGRYGPRQVLAQRYPWLLRNPSDLSFLASYATVMANSDFTRGYVERFWHVDADVLFPPIQVQRLHPSPEREKSVVTVGRFFAPGLGHSKRQLEMVQFFAKAHREGRLPGWRFHVLGGMEDSQRGYVDQVRAAGEGAPVEVVTNAPRSLVEQRLSTASVFWSATGYGLSEDKAPWASEHFGMTTVEAMAGGCVPVVIDKAGQKEIVREGVDGFRWQTPEQLVDRTVEISRDDALRRRLTGAAIDRAQLFSEQAFADRWHAIVDKHQLLG